MILSRIIIAASALCLFSLAASAQDSGVMDTKGRKLFVDENQLPDIAIPDYIGQANYENTYVPAVKQYKVGLGLLIPGCVLSALGIITLPIGIVDVALLGTPEHSQDKGIRNEMVICSNMGIVGVAVGSAMLGTDVTFYCIGKKRIQWCANDYNSKQSQVSFNVSSGKNGVGLALNF